MSEERRAARSRRLRAGAYLLPSLFTVANIFLGFYAVIRGLQGAFQPAALAIFAAGAVDGLDGRIARLTNTETEFGREFDSLADVLTFGFSPALLVYVWGLENLGRLGWLVPFLFVVCTASRLARFNVQVTSVDKRYFVGLPTPAAAGTVASALFIAPSSDWRPWLEAAVLMSVVALATLMVSTFRYHSFKGFDLRRRRSYRTALPIALVLLVLVWNPPICLVTLAVGYSLSGPAGWLLRTARGGRTTSEKTEGEPQP